MEGADCHAVTVYMDAVEFSGLRVVTDCFTASNTLIFPPDMKKGAWTFMPKRRY
jgi:hypothetical protein